MIPSFRASATDPGDDRLTYTWDFLGDGSVTATGQEVTYAYATAGTYSVNLSVFDGTDTTVTLRR